MKADTPAGWIEAAELWKSDTPSISVEEVQGHARRVRLHLIALVLAELLSSAIGIGAAAWLAYATPMFYLGLGIGVGIVLFTSVVLRWQGKSLRQTSQPALRLLETAVHRENQIREFLGVGRALMLAALTAVVMAASTLLRELNGGSLFVLMPLIASGLYLITVLLCCTYLDRRARHRGAVYRGLSEELGSVNASEAFNPIARKPDL